MDNEGRCVSCERYIGDALNCPYCDCEARHARVLRALRVGALVLAVLGVATLHARTRRAPVPLVRVTELMPHAVFRVAGSVASGPLVVRTDERADHAAVLWAPPRVIPLAGAILGPHLHWMLWCVIAFMLLSEWPRTMPHPGVGRARRFLLGWAAPLAGLVTFGLSGWLGILLFRCPPPALDRSMVALVPAFVGLFTVPSLLLLSAAGIAGAAAAMWAMPLSVAPRALTCRRGARRIARWSLVAVCALMWFTVGWAGMAVLAVATCIGALPVLFGARRIHCLGLVLLPAALNLSGL
jgi:hypothetical protein